MPLRDRIQPSPEQPLKVRGRPFQPGNPGRPVGSRNKTTVLLESLLEGDADKLVKKMIELAKQGNVRCLEYCLDRLLAEANERSVDLQLPKINSVQDIPSALAGLTEQISSGSIKAHEASDLVHLFDTYARAVFTGDLATRLERVEAALKTKMKIWNGGN